MKISNTNNASGVQPRTAAGFRQVKTCQIKIEYSEFNMENKTVKLPGVASVANVQPPAAPAE